MESRDSTDDLMAILLVLVKNSNTSKSAGSSGIVITNVYSYLSKSIQSGFCDSPVT